MEQETTAWHAVSSRVKSGIQRVITSPAAKVIKGVNCSVTVFGSFAFAGTNVIWSEPAKDPTGLKFDTSTADSGSMVPDLASV
jgi:hypothetical protein